MDSDETKTIAEPGLPADGMTEQMPVGSSSGSVDETMQTVALANKKSGRRKRADKPDPVHYERGAAIGRYIVLDMLGRGGMGVVYLAYDPELDRRVAVKVLRTRASHRVRQRLEREARALARLSHPNVVQVYDAGVHRGLLFMAMEYIEGHALDDWCKSDPPPSWRAILDVYIQVARGITAAHDKGMVHRDVKPANLLLGHDGRVCVADFGLAAAHDPNLDSSSDGVPDSTMDTEELSGDGSGLSTARSTGSLRTSSGPEADIDQSWRSSTGSSLRARLEDSLTRTGTLMGTPAYMAPEQQASGKCSPATDQYSFCAALYSSLYRVLPFTVENVRKQLKELLRRKKELDINAPPPDHSVPHWVHAVVMRGLAPKANERYPSMHDVLAALQNDPMVRRRALVRRLGTALVALLVAGLVVALLLRKDPAAEPPCAGVTRALEGIWDGSKKAEVQTAFLATELSYATSTAARVAAVLDDYAGAWQTMATANCRATRVHQIQAESVMTVRESCLERRRQQLSSLVELYARAPDPDILSKAVKAAQELPTIDYCGDVAALTAAVPPPEDPVLRGQVASLEQRLDDLASSQRAGKAKDVLGDGLALLADTSIVDFPPLQARALFVIGQMHMDVGKYAEAQDFLRRALPLAARAKDDRLLSRVWHQLWFVLGQRLARVSEAMHLKEAVFAAAERTGELELLAASHGYLAALQGVAGQYGAAVESFRRALEMREQAPGRKRIGMARYVGNLASAQLRVGDFQDALIGSERALSLAVANLGAGHPEIALYLTNLANAQSALGKYQNAMASHERALIVAESALGREHPQVAANLNNQADVLVKVGRYDDARQRAEQALAIWTESLGEQHPYVGVALVNLGNVARATGDHQAAHERYARAEGIMRKSFGDAHPFVAHALGGHGRVSVATGDLNAAEQQLRQALAIMEKAVGSDNPDLLDSLLGLGELAIARGQRSAAVAPLERALGLAGASPAVRAEIQFTLGRALWHSDARPRARELMGEARELFKDIAHQPKLNAVEEWLAGAGGRP